ncbi:autotransporter-associated beta strand repeat-containing protein [Rhodanobacter hydrolyticus]|uniref:Autotransporter-associated beta strand repeat-containing protein n=1 Tax=Rhodanobacter hydrolyticus TaxID=2250595 RepID=A0ABW8JDS9_9GAMM
MNRIYRLVWNRALRVLQVASEFAHSQGGAATGEGTSPMRRHPLALALSMVLGVALGAVAPQATAQTVVGGQGGAPGANAGSGASTGGGGAGGGGGGTSPANASGTGGTGGTSNTNNAGGAGGAPGYIGVGGAPTSYTGGAGIAGNGTGASGGGGGGGGAGYVLNNTGVLNNAFGNTLTGGAGGAGGAGTTNGGGGGGGGNGVLATSGTYISNRGTVAGGAGGAGGTGGVSGGGGGGGGNGITGSGIRIGNYGTITGGAGGAAGHGGTSSGYAGSNGDAVLFSGGTNTLYLHYGSVENGAIEVVRGATATIETMTSGLNLNGGTINGTANPTALIADGTTIIDTTYGALTISGVISGSNNGSGTGGSLESKGGTLTLTNTNTFSGATTIDSGSTLALTGSGSLAQSSGITANGTFDVSGTTSGASITSLSGNAGTVNLGGKTLALTNASGNFSGAIDGSGGLALSAGTETLAGNNGFTGATTINGGTLALSGSGSIAQSSNVVFSGAAGTFNISGTTSGATIEALNGSGTVNLGSKALTISGNGGTFGGVIQGNGGSLTIGSGASLTLTGNNTYTGGTTINGGTLVISSDANLGNAAGSLTLANDGTLYDQSTTSFTSARAVALSGAGVAETFDVVSGGTLTLSGKMSGSGALLKTDYGTLVLSNTSNNYSGGTYLQGGGTVSVSSDANLGATSGLLDFDGGWLQTTASFSSARAIYVTNGGGTEGAWLNVNNDTTLTLTGNVTGSGSNPTLNLSNGSGSVVYTGTSTNTQWMLQGGQQLTLGGSITPYSGTTNAVVLAGSSNTLTLESGYYLGGNVLSSGGGDTLALGGSGAASFNVSQITTSPPSSYTGAPQFFNFSNYTKTGSGTWTLGGTGSQAWTVAAGTLIGDPNSMAGDLAISSGATATFDVGSNNGNTGFATNGTYNGTISGAGSVSKIDDGTLTVSSFNYYNGGSDIQAGELLANNNNALGTGGVTIEDGATLGLGGGVSISNSISLNGNASIDVSSGHGTLNGLIDGSGSLTKTGSSSLTLAGNNIYTGITNISGGTLALSGSSSVAESSDVNVASGATFDVSGFNNGSPSIKSLDGSGIVALGGNHLMLTDASGTFSGTIQNSGIYGGSVGSVEISGGTETLAGYNLYTGGTYIDANATLALSGGADIASSSGVMLSGSLNATTGVVTNAGTLDISGITSSASIAGLSGVGFVNLGSQELTLTGGGTFQGVISDGGAGGSLALTGTTTETLTNANTYTGTTNIGSGATLVLAGSGSIANSSAVTANGTLDISGSTNLDVSIVSLDGNGSVTLGGNTLTLTNANGMFGGTVSDGGNGVGGKLVISGTETLSGNNTYTGGTTLSSGTLTVGNSSALGTGTLNMAAGTTLVLSNGVAVANALTINGDPTIEVDGSNSATYSGIISDGTPAGTLEKTGTGTLSLTAANTYTGATDIVGGTLTLYGGSIAASSDVNVGSGATLDTSNEGNAYITSLDGSGSVHLGQSHLTLTNASGTFSGVISDGGAGNTGSLEVSGGTETLNGVNTYTGQTTVDSGASLMVGDASNTTAQVVGNVVVNSDGTLSGHGSILGNVTLNDLATLALGGTGNTNDTALGTLTVGSLTAANGSIIDIAYGAPTSGDSIQVNGALALDGATLNVTNAGIMGPGVYKVISYTGTLNQLNGGLTLGTTPSGQSLALQSLAGQINLVDSTGVTLNYWNANGAASATQMGGGSGSWGTTSSTNGTNGTNGANWTNADGSAANGTWVNGNFAVFGGTAGTVTVNGSVDATGMQFAVDGYTVNGNFQLDPTTDGSTTTAPVIRVGDGSADGASMTATLNSRLTGTDGFTKTDLGTLVLTGDSENSLSGGITVAGGTLQIGDEVGNTTYAGYLNTPISMASGTTLVLDAGYLWSPGPTGSTLNGFNTVSGAGFTVTVSANGTVQGGWGNYRNSGTTVGNGGAGIYFGASSSANTLNNAGNVTGGGGGYSKNAVGGNGGAGVGGAGFTVNNAPTVSGNTSSSASIRGGSGNTGYAFSGGMGGAGISGTGFTVNNAKGASVDGGAGGYTYGRGAAAANGGAGGAGIGGSGFTVNNAGGIGGGNGNYTTGNGGISGTGGVGGAGIDGSVFALANAATGTITGGMGGGNYTGGMAGNGGAGVYVEAGANPSTLNNAGSISGGTGGSGNDGANGGNGGTGIGGSNFALVNSSSITGGNGANGGTGGNSVNGNNGGAGGNGGAGISGSDFTVTNTGSIVGGNGGSGGTPGNGGSNGTAGVGGVGLIAMGNSTVINAGSISGGNADGGIGAYADAVEFSGGGNTLTLESGYSFTGNVISSSGTTNGGDTLALGGSSNATFDLSQIVATTPTGWTGTVQYDGFASLAKTGSSTWIVTGSTASSATWTISDGTLQVGSGHNGGDGALTGSVTDNAALVFDNTATSTYAGVISGSGTLTQQGAGTLTLTGANTYTGGTTISSGTLQVGNGGSTGSITGNVADNGTLTFKLSGDTAFAGAITGSGALVQNGSGTLTLTGANDYTGGTTINTGTLVASSASLPGKVTDNAALVFDQASDGTLAGAIAGSGSLAKSGAGILILDGDSSAFAGTTTVQAGTLEVGDASTPSAALGSNVTVNSGATLRGHGSIGGNVVNNGTVWPGGSIGTLTIAGNYTQASNATLDIEVGATAASELKVGGTATLAGTLALTVDAGTYTQGQQFTLLSAGSVNGTFGTTTIAGASNFAFLTPTVSYAGNNVALTLTMARNNVSFPSVGQTPNQTATAAATQALGTGNPVYDAVVTLNAATARSAFAQLGGEIHASTRTAIMDDDHYVRDAINQHIAGQSNDANGLNVTDADGVTAWTSTWGHWGSHDGNSNASTMDSNGSGLLFGADLPLGTARLGAVMSTGEGSTRIDAQGSAAHTLDQHLGVYGSAQTGALLWQGAAIYGWQKVDTHRAIDFGSFNGVADSSYHAHTAQAYLDGSLPFVQGNTTLAPFANLAVERLSTPSVQENGTPAALDVAGQDSTVGYGTLGLRASFDLGAANHGLHAHASLGWQHAWGDVLPVDTMRFASGSDSFDITGTPVLRNAGVANAGISFTIAPNVTVDGTYQGQFGKQSRDQSGRISLDWKF